MNREATELWSAALGAAGTVIRYGYWGRPVLVFPSERGRAWDFEDNGMVGAVEDLIGAGRLKLFCVDSYDAASWSDQGIPLLAGKGIRHELDLWGYDVPHDWPSWRAQLACHMPRFC